MLTDPTYLRYIVDGLHSQSIQQENLAALPQGLIGIYEEALPWEQNIQERGRFLQFFSAWALLKKEVSAPLVSSLLNWPEQEVIDKLSTYTKWFNSPSSGTYILYHERLRTYLLSKITSNQLKQTNQRIIESCQLALELKKGDEWETYALEHLPSHLLIPAMQDEEQGASFRKLVYDTSYWNRQLEISKGYDWSKKMLNLAMVWAAKQNTDELIECALNKIDLHYMEQNDGPRIVELVAQNDIETALQRIESFGGNDKEGLQRKFTLYMLCLMELTLLDSKDKPFRKSAIEKLLNHLDENIPVKHSLLNWNDFFPSYLVYLIVIEIIALDLDGIKLFKRTRFWDFDWINCRGPYSDIQIDTLIKCVDSLSNKISALIEISKALYFQGKIRKSELVLKNAYKIAKSVNNISELVAVSMEYYERGNDQQSKLAMSSAISNAYLLMNSGMKNRILSEISIALVKQMRPDDALDILNDINEQIKGGNYEKVKAIKDVAISLYSFGRENEALDLINKIEFERIKILSFLEILSIEIDNSKSTIFELFVNKIFKVAMDINDELTKLTSLAKLSTELLFCGQKEISKKCINESLILIFRLINKPGFYDVVNNGFNKISIEYAKQRNVGKAIYIVNKIEPIDLKIQTYLEISEIFYFNGKRKWAYELVDQASCFISNLKDNKIKDSLFVELSTLIFKFGYITKSFDTVSAITNFESKKISIKKISSELVSNKKFAETIKLFNELIRFQTNSQNREVILNQISIDLYNKGVLKNSVGIAKGINEKHLKFDTLISIYSDLIEKEMFNDALFVSEYIDADWRVAVFADLSTKFAKNGFLKESILLIKRCFDEVKSFNWELNKNLAYKDISIQLANQGKYRKAFRIINDYITEYEVKSKVFIGIAKAYIDNFEVKKAIKLNEEKFNGLQVTILQKIAIDYAKQADFKKAIKFSKRIIFDIDTKISTLVMISIELSRHEVINNSHELILNEIRGLNNNYDKIRNFKNLLSADVDISKVFDINAVISELLECITTNLVEELNLIVEIISNYINVIDIDIILSKIFEIPSQEKGPQYVYLLIKISKLYLKKNNNYESDNLLNNAFEYALEFKHIYVLKKVAFEYFNRKEWAKFEEVFLKINNQVDQEDCINDIYLYNSTKLNTNQLFVLESNLLSKEIRRLFIKVSSSNIRISNCTSDIIVNSLCKLQDDFNSLENILYKYLLHQIFFSNAPQNEIDRLNKTLNIQWAIDIKESLVAE